MRSAATCLCLAAWSVLACAESPPRGQVVLPVLEFPEPVLDDTAAYHGYATRFFKDTEGNAVQVYLKRAEGRIVHVWADAANESAGFTARDTAGRPAPVTWGSAGAEIAAAGPPRSITYVLRFDVPRLEVGHVLLGSMRLERDLQYFERHLVPWSADPFVPEELPELIANLERLPPGVRDRHVAALRADGVGELRARLQPEVTTFERDTLAGLRIEHVSFDGVNHLTLELGVDHRRASLETRDRSFRIRSLDAGPLDLWIRVTTDAPALHALTRDRIFDAAFLERVARARAEYDRLRFRRLERQITGFELLSYEEKLMAGLPNFATYFGRDMLMTALLMEPIWRPQMLEHVVGSVLRKLSPSGEVSHEEALGGQAIRENAAEYNRVVAEVLVSPLAERVEAERLLETARSILENLQAVRENYQMRDDDFQFPVVAARYLESPGLSRERKRAFLLAPARAGGPTRLTALLANLDYVARASAPYAADPAARNLVAFARLEDGRWHSGSWRDSRAGYANGRFAMDINAIWVPNALEALGAVLATLEGLGFTSEELRATLPEGEESPLLTYLDDRRALDEAVTTWRGAATHFGVTLAPAEIRRRLAAKLEWMPGPERAYWQEVLRRTGAARDGVRFLALSLDADGRPIPIPNTDPATALLLEDYTEGILRGERRIQDAYRILDPLERPYPVGLFVAGLGPLAANDAYASRDVWEAFRADHYHSPTVVWGREVNVLLAGLGRQIEAAYGTDGTLRRPDLAPYVRRLAGLLDTTRDAVEASGLKHHELWSYRVEGDTLRPVRYGISTDVQLWNLTDLAVQAQLARTTQP